MNPPASLDDLTKSIPFADHLRFVLTRGDAEGAVVEAIVTPAFCTAGDIAHGGFLMALADYTGAVGALYALPGAAAGTTTLESKTNMVRAAKVGSRLRATATAVHVGRRTSVWTTRIETVEGQLISVTTQTQMTI